MIARRLQNLLLLLLVFLAPAVWRPERLTHPAFPIAFSAALIVLLIHPRADPKELVSSRGADALSGVLLFAAGLGCMLISVLDFTFSPAAELPRAVDVEGGTILCAVGCILRLWSIHVLGRFFTATVSVQENHRVVRSGPYAVLRHPSYAAVLMILGGIAWLLRSPIGGLAVVLLALPAYRYRIRREEAVLVRALGTSYAEYREQTKALIPFLY